MEAERETEMMKENDVHELDTINSDENVKMLGAPTLTRNTSHISVFEIEDSNSGSNCVHEAAISSDKISSANFTRVRRRRARMTNGLEFNNAGLPASPSYREEGRLEKFERNSADRNAEIVHLSPPAYLESRQSIEIGEDIG